MISFAPLFSEQTFVVVNFVTRRIRPEKTKHIALVTECCAEQRFRVCTVGAFNGVRDKRKITNDKSVVREVASKALGISAVAFAQKGRNNNTTKLTST